MQHTIMKNNHPVTCDDSKIVDDNLLSDLPKNTQQKITNWIKRNFTKCNTKYEYSSSYGLKHLLEKDTGIYVTNNQFKDAMLIAGFNPCDKKELNWEFNIDPFSPAFAPKSEDIAKKLRKIREEDGMSQTEFAQNLGVPVSTYRKWEQNVNMPPYYIFTMINMLSNYREKLWRYGIYDDIAPETKQQKCYQWEHKQEQKNGGCTPTYADFRIYHDPEKDCYSLRMYKGTWYSITKNHEIFNDIIEMMFAKYNTKPFVNINDIIAVIENDMIGGDTLELSIGKKCKNQYMKNKETYMSISTYYNNTIVEFPIDNGYENYNTVIWTKNGKTLEQYFN